MCAPGSPTKIPMEESMAWKIFSLRSALITLLGLLFFIGANGQEISVTSFKALPNDMTARTTAPVKDANGQLSALIKVVSVEAGFVFEGGSLGIVKAEQKEGEWWVYVPQGARTMTIRHASLGILRNYAYPVAISSGSVYEMKLVHGVIETTIIEHQILTEFVIISSEPSGAEVYLNNEAVGKTPFTADKPEGRYEWRVERHLYQTQAGVFDLISGTRFQLYVTLKPDYGSVEVLTSPEEGASVFLDGIEMKIKTPCILNRIPSGKHTITLTHEWYKTTSQEIVVEPEQNQTINVFMNPTYGQLTVKALIDEEVFINNYRKGIGSWTGRLAPGVYMVEIQKPSHKSAMKQVNLQPGDTLTVELSLSPIRSSIKVLSTPIDAEIYLNGKYYGITPKVVRDLIIGEYELELRKSGFGTYKTIIVVEEGVVNEINKTLSSNGRLSIKTNPSGAEVYLDGVYKGISPLEIEDLPPKKYTYDIRKKGFKVFRDFVVVEMMKTTSIDKTLIKLEGSLQISSKPPGADIFIDGKYMGKTPTTIKNIMAKTVIVELKMNNYHDIKETSLVESDGITHLDFKLKETKESRIGQRTGAKYLLYSYEQSIPYGISFGGLKTQGKGIYFSLAMNESYFIEESFYVYDNGTTNSPMVIVPSGEELNGSFSGSMGYNFKLTYPIWLSLGVGVMDSKKLIEYTEYTSNGYFISKSWFLNPDQSGLEYSIETGLALKIGNTLVFQYIIANSIFDQSYVFTPNFNLRHRFSLGFQL